MATILISIKRFDTSLPLPAKHTKGAVAYDVYSRLQLTIKPQTVAYIPLNVALQLPDDYWVMIAARSSLHKRGLWLANSIGVVDSDYSGNEDEYMAAVYNFTHQDVVVQKGDRVAQLIIMPVIASALNEVDELKKQNRGGFGTTGVQ